MPRDKAASQEISEWKKQKAFKSGKGCGKVEERSLSEEASGSTGYSRHFQWLELEIVVALGPNMAERLVHWYRFKSARGGRSVP